jgi:hypothetical protein
MSRGIADIFLDGFFGAWLWARNGIFSFWQVAAIRSFNGREAVLIQLLASYTSVPPSICGA